MPQNTPRPPRIKPQPTPGGWISERALAQIYGIPQQKIKNILKRTGLHYREIRFETEGGCHFVRTYWPAQLHPAARPISKPQPEPET